MLPSQKMLPYCELIVLPLPLTLTYLTDCNVVSSTPQ